MSGTELLGFAAAILTTVCWLPQAVKTIRTKDTSRFRWSPRPL
jgi:MtN3 and saliva related transmembrane protein